MKYILRAVTIAAGLSALGACSQAEPVAPPTLPATSSSMPPAASSSTPQPSRTSVGPLPAAVARPGLTTLIAVAPTTGSQIVGRIQVKPGELWLNATCRGRGELVVSFEPMGRFTIPCSDVVQPSANQMTQANSGELTLSVTATEGVEWSLRAQQ